MTVRIGVKAADESYGGLNARRPPLHGQSVASSLKDEVRDGGLDEISQHSHGESYGEAGDSQQPAGQNRTLIQTTGGILERVLTTRSINDPGPPPDGGLRAWTQVACGWIVIFTTWGWVNSFGAFQTYYSLHLTEPASTISWIGTIQNFLTFFVGALSGRLLDAGLYLPTLIVGTIVQLLGIFLLSISSQYWHFILTQGVLTGLGGGMFFTPSVGLIATYFDRHRALAVGLATTGNAVGGMIYPVLVRELLPVIGFGWTVRVLGFVNMALLAVVLGCMRPRLPPRKSGPLIDWAAFREAPYALYVAGLFFAVWAVYYTFYYIGSFGVEVVGMDYSSSTTLVILINGVGVPARVIPPFFADRTGPLNIMFPSLLALSIIAFCWLVVDSAAGVYCFTAFYGLANASFQCLMPTAVASITPDLRMVGTRLGMAFSTLSFAALTGPPIGGALQAAMNGRYEGASLFAALATLISSCLVLGTRTTRVGWTLWAKA